jgi:hypothetical protein
MLLYHRAETYNRHQKTVPLQEHGGGRHSTRHNWLLPPPATVRVLRFFPQPASRVAGAGLLTWVKRLGARHAAD